MSRTEPPQDRNEGFWWAHRSAHFVDVDGDVHAGDEVDIRQGVEGDLDGYDLGDFLEVPTGIVLRE